LADENISSLSAENLNSDVANDHKILLLKARNCFYLTLDRLRSPGTDPKHRLNAEIHTYINTVDSELPKYEQNEYLDGGCILLI
jgi:E3 SUMO-protein ligase RanBP2